MWKCSVCNKCNKLGDENCEICTVGRGVVDPEIPEGAPPDWSRMLTTEELQKRLDDFEGQAFPGGCVGTKVARPGIINSGNTCFAGSGLQVLLSVDKLCEIFTNPDFARDGVRQTRSQGYAGDLALAWAGFTRASKKGCGPLHISGLMQVIGRVGHLGKEFTCGKQHDPSSLMQHLLNGLFEDTKYATPGKGKDWANVTMSTRRLVTPKSPVRDLFGITILRRHTCVPSDGTEGCVVDSRVFVPRLDLAIPKPPNPAEIVSLENCLTHFNRPFSSGVTGPCSNPNCKKVGTKSWKAYLENPPDALLLVLERFDDPHGEKLNTPVKIQQVIHSLKHTQVLLPEEPEVAYELRGLTLHSGSRFGGHYIAVVRAPTGNGWLMCNDAKVEPLTEFQTLMDTGAFGTFNVTTALYTKRPLDVARNILSQHDLQRSLYALPLTIREWLAPKAPELYAMVNLARQKLTYDQNHMIRTHTERDPHWKITRDFIRYVDALPLETQRKNTLVLLFYSIKAQPPEFHATLFNLMPANLQNDLKEIESKGILKTNETAIEVAAFLAAAPQGATAAQAAARAAAQAARGGNPAGQKAASQAGHGRRKTVKRKSNNKKNRRATMRRR